MLVGVGLFIPHIVHNDAREKRNSEGDTIHDCLTTPELQSRGKKGTSVEKSYQKKVYTNTKISEWGSHRHEFKKLNQKKTKMGHGHLNTVELDGLPLLSRWLAMTTAAATARITVICPDTQQQHTLMLSDTGPVGNGEDS